jgi:hypothetical protein
VFKLFKDRAMIALSEPVGETVSQLVEAVNLYFETDVQAPKESASGKFPSRANTGAAKAGQKERVLHDAGLSIRYGLEKGVFLGRFEVSQQ